MKERLITLSCALGALALFFTMFMHHDGSGAERKEVMRPTTQERGPNGYRAAMEWLSGEHTHTVSVRDRFDKLVQRPGLALTGNVLIVTLPAATPFKTEEFRPLDGWVRQGNTVLVLAALSDSPDWAFAVGGLYAADLNLLTGLEFETVKSREARMRETRMRDAGVLDKSHSRNGAVESRNAVIARPFTEPRRSVFVANRPHPYLSGVNEGVALSDYSTQAWTSKVPYEGFVFALAHQRETGEGVLWTRRLGSGRIIVSAVASIFTNRALGLADNARLLANIVGADLSPGGTVLFDDLHQGLGAAYDPEKFYRDRRLHLTAGILALVWMSWVLGATKLRLQARRAPAPREAELVRATGGFLARVLTPAAAARMMFDRFLRRCSWEILERHPRIAAADVRQLRSWYADANASSRVPLARLHNLIVRITRQLRS